MNRFIVLRLLALSLITWSTHIKMQGMWNNVRRENRRLMSEAVRMASCVERFQTQISSQPTNGDDVKYANHIGSFSKMLKHNSQGIVNQDAYDSLINALKTADPNDFNNIVFGSGAVTKYWSPQAAYAFTLLGADAAINAIPPAPALDSAEAAGEMVELYWHALLRDVPFNKYATDALAADAIADLNTLSNFKGPKIGNNVTAGTLFRGQTPGDLQGPFISQFLYKPIPLHGGAMNVNQIKKVPVAGTTNDFLTTFSDWLIVQNGGLTGDAITFDSQPTFIRSARDLGDWVHLDFLYESFLNAALILLSYGSSALDDNNPYKTSPTQTGMVTYGPVEVLAQIAAATQVAMSATWYQKWMVHMRLRPEYYGFLVNKKKNGDTSIPLHIDVMKSAALTNIFNTYGSYFLPQQYPEGCPGHPSYPAGHATMAGACATILKAFFKESFVIPNPVEPDSTNTSLISYTATSLTVGNELNKLAANIAIGRNMAGVHYRSDGIQGILLGEKIAISILEDVAWTKNEDFAGYSLTKFDGTIITVGAKKTV